MAAEIWLVVVCVVTSACALVMTGVLWVTARDARQVCRLLNAMLPSCDRSVQETHRVLTEARRLLARANHAARSVESVVQRACETASDVMEHVTGLSQRARTLWRGRSRNGARSGPRRSERGS